MPRRVFGRSGRGLAAMACIAALASGAVACGSGGEQSPSPSGHSAAKLRIGVLANVTGPLPSGEENAPPVLKAWAKYVNADGGISGHQVEMVVADTKGDAPTATTAARRIASDKSIVAVILFDAATEALIADTITKAGLPVIGGMGYATNAWGKMPNWFPLTTSIPSIFNMGMVLGKTLGAHTTALTICAEIPGCAQAGPVVQKASESQGMKYAGTLKISSSAPSHMAECLRIKKENVDYVMLGAATATAALRVANECGQQGYTGRWGLFGGVVVPKAMRENDPGVRLDLALNSFPWFADAPPVRRYRDVMSQQGVPEPVWGDPHSTAAYATVELFRKALQDAVSVLPTSPGRRDVIAAYGRVTDENLGGLLPQKVTFHAGQPAQPIACYWFGSFKSGQFGDGDLGKPVCDPPQLRAVAK
ncbi:branched-chain amino acid ABC transporter substrate-binding protein [Actinomadura soli]|uniref:Branched-chain amino acid ABC transporter substrate-binding protein n=1 Tax=Actinomadura soli TaxID=2508997 RepID=A0A5C4JIU3_9ACTN|nr:ABC transporter substrate-binding protein [Actinomadura soli]TMR05701.1 branched-chain amino acid ABC transporter substrate-binding protein [Actinomadura soli]